jgi:hypothetical protein
VGAIGKALLIIVVVFPPALFWFVYLIPESGSENWFRVIAWLLIAPLCLFSIAACLHLARKASTGLPWWFLLAFSASPVLWTVAEYLFTSQK